ncbi:MAG: T9SS type A sorting domain-containing protein [Bacteroidetes bacterium]|nr:T9SS type A sorting domain-containing protein [Bacteroidota bacterium]
MKKTIFLLLMMPMIALAQVHKPGKVSQAITEAKADNTEFQSFEVHNALTKNVSADYAETVSDGVVFTLDQSSFQSLLAQNPEQMSLSLPFKSNGETVTVDLMQVEVFAPDFKAVTDTGQDITNEVDFGKHYKGVISGNEHSLVAISIYESQISGFIANSDGNYTLGKIRSSDVEHIIYKDSDLNVSFDFNCSMEDDGVGYTVEQLTAPTQESDPGDIVDVYVEAGQSVYNTFGQNLPNTVAFLTNLFTQSYILYSNDGIIARTSNMMIWVNPDPYNGGDSSSQLGKFAAQTDFLNGDLGHLVMMQNFGGIAAGFSGICPNNSDASLCYSGLAGTNVQDVPLYSFNVYLISHEMGHLLGSRHTHACVWNGDDTAIDSCSGFTEGGCPLPGNPAGGGTIMSYCGNTNVGIDFNLGFGPQPLAVIMNNILEDGNCLEEEPVLIPPTAVCKTHIVTLDTNGEATIELSDIEGGSYDDDGIDSMSIDVTTLTCADVGYKDVTLTVTDTDGLVSTCISYVEVIDGTEVVLSCPDDLTVSVPAGTNYVLEDFQDDFTLASAICDQAPFLASSQNPNPGNELEIGVHVITINVLITDGVVESCTFEITVEEEVLGLDDNSILSSLVLYPNPAVETLFVSNPENLALESISIYDIAGRLIKLVDLNEMGIERTIDVSELSASNYFAVIQGAEGKIVKQLIIQ